MGKCSASQFEGECSFLRVNSLDGEGPHLEEVLLDAWLVEPPVPSHLPRR